MLHFLFYLILRLVLMMIYCNIMITLTVIFCNFLPKITDTKIFFIIIIIIICWHLFCLVACIISINDTFLFICFYTCIINYCFFRFFTLYRFKRRTWYNSSSSSSRSRNSFIISLNRSILLCV